MNATLIGALLGGALLGVPGTIRISIESRQAFIETSDPVLRLMDVAGMVLLILILVAAPTLVSGALGGLIGNLTARVVNWLATRQSITVSGVLWGMLRSVFSSLAFGALIALLFSLVNIGILLSLAFSDRPSTAAVPEELPQSAATEPAATEPAPTAVSAVPTPTAEPTETGHAIVPWERDDPTTPYSQTDGLYTLELPSVLLDTTTPEGVALLEQIDPQVTLPITLVGYRVAHFMYEEWPTHLFVLHRSVGDEPMSDLALMDEIEATVSQLAEPLGFRSFRLYGQGDPGDYYGDWALRTTFSMNERQGTGSRQIGFAYIRQDAGSITIMVVTNYNPDEQFQAVARVLRSYTPDTNLPFGVE
jgi:hypothetical protein